ncbi:conserved hypothetical protein [Saccharomyces cerevisiae RM11-1a]|uniref:Dipeptidyl peptidase 3 n=1 Tax=Saccharomyces cerevisiae (strain RM11-1a) TaxID=285006 RepID=B3LJ02_YEAS1|nr:conserved hypothetical protein [Saccharomyces cerevisiae RM11-1a]CAI4772295.1 ATM_1a_G0049320.mRNA.1.CDS.1 [Saccharomyces cerevisiae]CAI7335483.1 ATM_1a_G0049320.mRNA.1.CDS.1 [Saccharomyces cerevisiae]
MSHFFADHDAPLSMLSVKTEYFPQLTDKEQKYAHFMSKASHAGSRVVMRQVSHESEPIFDLILAIHSKLNGKYPEDDITQKQQTGLYLEYVSQFLSNLANFKSFGDTKFIPRCEVKFFKQLLELAKINPCSSPLTLSPVDVNHEFTSHHLFSTINELIDIGIYHVEEKAALLGFPSQGYTSAYYLGLPVTPEDMALLKEQLFAELAILPENTRINKVGENSFQIWVASENVKNQITETYPSGQITLSNAVTKVEFIFGDHSREMRLVASYLKEAQKFAANDTQKAMLQEYINHFVTGSSQAHKEAQKLWVKDISPVIETNIGFIETYREPSGIIGEFESLVAIQNKERTAKFSSLVNNAEEFISLLPWSKDYEKPIFNPPDFTSLEVLTFTGSGIPAGINIPNYDDVRLKIGFKNVSLGNILSAAAKSSSKHPPSFISQEDRPIFEKYQSDSFEVQVGIHELLGHGSGKLLTEFTDGFNFDKENPPLGLDGKPVSTYYKVGETWGSKFGQLAGPFEECRAEVIAMFLLTNKKILDIFGFHDVESQDKVIYAGYLQMARAGLLALEYWNPKTGKWGQPHMQARFSIMKTFMKHSTDKNFLKLEMNSTNDDFAIKLDKSLIKTAGHECVKDYLKHLHVYKCSGDVEQGSKYFIDRSTVTPDLASLRDIVLSKRLPRRQFIQSNSYIDDNNKVTLKEYDETPQGMLQSFLDREL